MATSSDWQRLAALVSERRGDLALTQEDVRAAGGPSTATQRLIERGQPSHYQPRILAGLETALGWQHGSIRRILAGGDPVPVTDTLTAAPLPTTPEPPRELVAEDADADAMESAVAVALTPRRERLIWTDLRDRLAATPAGAELFSDAAQSRAWPPGSAPLDLTEKAAAVLNAIVKAGQVGMLAVHPINHAAFRLTDYIWPERVALAAAMHARISGASPTVAVRRAG